VGDRREAQPDEFRLVSDRPSSAVASLFERLLFLAVSGWPASVGDRRAGLWDYDCESDFQAMFESRPSSPAILWVQDWGRMPWAQPDERPFAAGLPSSFAGLTICSSQFCFVSQMTGPSECYENPALACSSRLISSSETRCAWMVVMYLRREVKFVFERSRIQRKQDILARMSCQC
jgi:hypothetical protein